MIFVFLFHSKINANEPDSLFRSNSLTINAGQLCLSEINIRYENFLLKKYPHVSLNGALGYKFSQMKESVYNLDTPNFWADLFGYFWSQSLYGSVSIKTYFKKSLIGKWPKYLELEPFYRNNNFRKKMIYYDEGQDDGFTNIDKLQSSIEHVIGIKIFYGMKTYSYTTKKTNFAYGFYFGLGIRAKYLHKITYGDSVSGGYNIDHTNHDYTPYNSPIIENYWADQSFINSSFPLLPSAHFGIKLGLGWKKNMIISN